MKIYFLLACLSLLLACATTRSLEAERILESDKTEMTQKKCEALGYVRGTSALNGPLVQNTGKNNAKNEALDEAVAKQATHVVWKELDLGFWELAASADAYRCSQIQ